MNLSDGTWKRCSVCKKPIALRALYWTCNVSTCNRKRTALRFCTVSCWDSHLPFANHRESWAVEQTAPASADPEEAAPRAGSSPQRRIVRDTQPAAAKTQTAREVMVVASRLKDYVRAKSGYNTSDTVLGPLSDIIRRVADEAIANARRDGRMTVLERDLPKP